MSDGGPSEQAKLRERFAVALAGNPGYCLKEGEDQAEWLTGLLDHAQLCTDEALKRREDDRQNAERGNAKLQAGAEAMEGDPLYATGDE